MKPFELSITGWILRFYLTMGIILVAGFTNNWWIAILAFPVVLSTILGIKFGNKQVH